MFRNSVVLFVASGQRCAIRGKDAGVHSSHAGFPNDNTNGQIMCDKKGRCKVPGCKGTPKVMCKKFNVHLCFTAEKKCFLKFNTE